MGDKFSNCGMIILTTIDVVSGMVSDRYEMGWDLEGVTMTLMFS